MKTGEIILLILCLIILSLSFLLSLITSYEDERANVTIKVDDSLIRLALHLNGATQAILDIQESEFTFIRNGEKCILFNHTVMEELYRYKEENRLEELLQKWNF